jgi:uncharacterized membrane protein YfcA/uncharacterized membrane protein YedE/YeeE
MITIAGVLSLLVGLMLGLLGGGGSILLLPLLVYVAGVRPDAAVALSLLVVAATSSVALFIHARAGHVRWRIGLALGGAGMVGAYAGGSLSRILPDWSLLVGFSALMVWTSIAMLRGQRGRTAPTAAPEHEQERRSSMPRVLAQGAAIGVLAGLLGAGGGFLVVPAMVLFAGLSMRAAIGTSLLVIAMQSTAGLLAHLQHGSLDWQLAAWTGLPAVVGGLVGSRLASHVPQARLRSGFAWLVLAVGVLMLGAQLWALGEPAWLRWVSPWLAPLAGGVVIGGAGALLWLLAGRIAGVSGIVGGIFSSRPDGRRWRIGFLLGLVVGGAVIARLAPAAFEPSSASLPLAVVAGALVGVGTTLANGCTSGHGVCGTSRLSKRSIAATATFMAAGIVAVYLARVVGIGASA